jgi:exonuclease VII large subunit
MQGQHKRETDALMDRLIAFDKSLSETVAKNERGRQAWERHQKQEREEMDREREAWGHQQQQALEQQKQQLLEQVEQERQAREQQNQQLLEQVEQERQAREQQKQQLLEQVEQERQAREQQFQRQSAAVNRTLEELRSDVVALVQFSDVYVLNMAAEVIKRFLKKQTNVGASWVADSIFGDRERDIVRTSLNAGGVQYDVGRFAELSAALLNTRNSAIHFAEDGGDLPSLAQDVVRVREHLSRPRALDPTVAFALNVLQMSGVLLSHV